MRKVWDPNRHNHHHGSLHLRHPHLECAQEVQNHRTVSAWKSHHLESPSNWTACECSGPCLLGSLFSPCGVGNHKRINRTSVQYYHYQTMTLPQSIHPQTIFTGIDTFPSTMWWYPRASQASTCFPAILSWDDLLLLLGANHHSITVFFKLPLENNVLCQFGLKRIYNWLGMWQKLWHVTKDKLPASFSSLLRLRLSLPICLLAPYWHTYAPPVAFCALLHRDFRSLSICSTKCWQT